MIMKYLVLGFVFGVFMLMILWIVGMILNSLLMKIEYYKKLFNLNFVISKVWNKCFGIKYFKWIVKNIFFKFFN